MFANKTLAGEPAGVGVVDSKRLVSRWNAHELAAVRTLHAGECGHHVALGHHEVSGELQIRKRSDEHAEECLKTFTIAGELGGKGPVVIRTIWGDQLIRGVDVVAVHDPVV